jgi:Glycosyltransferase Family 4
MSRDVIAPTGSASGARSRAAKHNPPLKILVVSTSLIPGRRFPAPVTFVNALAEQGMTVMFAAEVGPLRNHLTRAVHYLLVDTAEDAPIKTAHELSGLIRHHHPDVVHAHGVRCAMVAALAVKACRAQCGRVMTVYSPGLLRFPNWIKGPMLRRAADRYLAANEELAQELEELGVPAERIRLEPIDDRHAAGLARASIAIYRQLAGASGSES